MCKLCETKPVYEFTNKRKLCRICFIRWFQKKVLYTIRKFKMIKVSGTKYLDSSSKKRERKEDVVGYRSGKGFRGVVLEDVLKMFAGKGHVKVKKGIKNVNKIAVSDTVDINANIIIKSIIKSNINKITSNPVEGKIIRPLYLFLDKEVLLYARLRGLKFKKIKEDKDKIISFIDKLEEKHPEVKRAVVNAYLGLAKT